MPRKPTQQGGAQAERDSARRRIRRRLGELEGLGINDQAGRVVELQQLLDWLDGRTKRFNRAKGGLGREKPKPTSKRRPSRADAADRW